MNDRYAASAAARIVSLVAAVLCTLSIMAGIDELAQVDTAAPQIALAVVTHRG